MSNPISADGRSYLRHWPVLWFFAILSLHVTGILQGWNNENLPGHEFRQAQTALSTYFIEREGDYSLAYPTPVLGKPWSVPFEFPLYEWTVAALHHVTGYPLVQSARLVSAVCLYLGLPALWLLLGRAGVDRSRRWLVLGLVLTCPVYVFYARAFLIETMALMFSLWFLQAFAAALEERSWSWLVVANVAGVGAGLVKVTTFAIVLIAAAGWTVWVWWRGARSPGAVVRLAGWCAGLGVVPFAATVWWVHYADAVKANNPAAAFALSGRLRDFNFGSWHERLDPALWLGQLGNLTRGVAGPAVLVLGAVALALAGRRRGWAAAALGVFGAPLLVFPVLYKVHDYYFSANAVFLAAALGIALIGLLEEPGRRWWAVGLLLVLPVLQVRSYLGNYWGTQAPAYPAGGHLERLLHAITAEDDVLVIAGRDWDSTVPYHARRRALMFHGGSSGNAGLVERSFGALDGEVVGALVLTGAQRTNQRLCAAAVGRFGLDPRPLFSLGENDVYVPAAVWPSVLDFLYTVPVHALVLPPKEATDQDPWRERLVEVGKLPMVVRRHFRLFSPEPVRAWARFSFSCSGEGNDRWFSAHPDTRLWFVPPARHCRLNTSYQIYEGAYKDRKPGDGTDGVQFTLLAVTEGGERRILFDRFLDPIRTAGDRGVQQLALEFEVALGEELLFEVTPGPAGNWAFDWAALGPFELASVP